MNRLTDNDKNWGPFTLARWKNTFTASFNTADDEDESSHLLLIAFGWALRISLPNIIPPYREKVEAKSWDAETIQRLGRDWYFKIEQREFGFSLSNMGNGYDFLQIRFGRQAHDSSTDKTWSKSLPWKQWDCVRHSLYAPNGTHFYTEPHWKERRRTNAKPCYDMKEQCPAAYFGFEDHDGEMIVATCHIEEMEWHRGEGWFRWMKYFYAPRIRRSLDLSFSAEVGVEKGSWKGGTIGHGIEMLGHESCRQAFERYCSKEHDGRNGRKYRIRFIGPCESPNTVTVS